MSARRFFVLPNLAVGRDGHTGNDNTFALHLGST